MGATNLTLHYQLSQFISTDKPAWLQDYNGDMQKIDNGINGALVAAESAQNSADTANTGVGAVSDAVTALQTTVAGHTSDITDLSGDVNTIEELIGNGTPTAGDHTLIGGINANAADISSLYSALEWKEFGTTITTTPVALPSAREYLFVANMGSGVVLTINVPPQYLSGGPRGFRSGYSNNNASAMVSITIQNGNASLENAFLNGNSVTPSIYAYYR